MKEILEKLKIIESEIVQERGSIELFALFLRENSVGDRWDLLLASEWAESDKYATLDYINQKIKKYFNNQEMIILSRIVIIEQNNPALSAIQSAFAVKSGNIEVRNSNLFGLEISHAYIFTSQKR
jgi:hypothetical protein